VVIARTRLFDGLDQEEISNLLAILRKMQQNSRGPFRKGHRATTGSQKRA
jgi:hypothetical protein